MKYSIVKYGFPTQLQNNYIAIGIILQSDKDLDYKFDLSDRKFKQIKQILPQADPDTFKNFEKTFQESFIDPDKIIISNGNGNPKEIVKTDPEFLHYLHTTFLGSYSYTQPTPIEGNDTKTVLDYLYTKLVAT